MDANEGGDLPDGEQGPVHVGAGAVPRIVTDRQFLIRHAEDDLGADHITGQANGVSFQLGLGAWRPREGDCGSFPMHARETKTQPI